jgi:hypothetical protein
MALRGQRTMRVGAPVSIAFFLDGVLVAAEAIVRWAKAPAAGYQVFGVSFELIDDRSRAVIAAHCQTK